MKNLIACMWLLLWIIGAVLSTGWAMFFAVIFPPYAWYVSVAHFMKLWGLL